MAAVAAVDPHGSEAGLPEVDGVESPPAAAWDVAAVAAVDPHATAVGSQAAVVVE